MRGERCGRDCPCLATQPGSTLGSSSAVSKPLYRLLHVVLILSPGLPWGMAWVFGPCTPEWAHLSPPQTCLVSQGPHAEDVDLHHLFRCPGSHSAFSPSTDYTKTEKPAQGHMAMTFSISPKANVSCPSCDQGPTEAALPEGDTVVVNG